MSRVIVALQATAADPPLCRHSTTPPRSSPGESATPNLWALLVGKPASDAGSRFAQLSPLTGGVSTPIKESPSRESLGDDSSHASGVSGTSHASAATGRDKELLSHQKMLSRDARRKEMEFHLHNVSAVEASCTAGAAKVALC